MGVQNRSRQIGRKSENAREGQERKKARMRCGEKGDRKLLPLARKPVVDRLTLLRTAPTSAFDTHAL